jgi:precorrin-2 dehydrogenase/sirohydrochlorin ferrochelatase
MSMEITYLPISVNISTAHILIVGGGKVATHKATILNRFTDRATVIAPQISDGIKALPFMRKERMFWPSDLDGVNILFACTGNHQLNSQIKVMAGQRGILTSVCDAPSLCDFVSPAIYRNNNMTIAVGSDARDVKRSIRIRDRIKTLIENDILQID